MNIKSVHLHHWGCHIANTLLYAAVRSKNGNCNNIIIVYYYYYSQHLPAFVCAKNMRYFFAVATIISSFHATLSLFIPSFPFFRRWNGFGEQERNVLVGRATNFFCCVLSCLSRTHTHTPTHSRRDIEMARVAMAVDVKNQR